ncbi:MAG: hypothetical protein EOO13_03360 [Chitinophagaceae bacterium]|nr:MAG: hypothetical protein EOO13_03360 [Chitinophagaceae bacterium]
MNTGRCVSFLIIVTLLFSCKKEETKMVSVSPKGIDTMNTVYSPPENEDSLQFIPVRLPKRNLTQEEAEHYIEMAELYMFKMGKNIDVSDLSENLSDKIVNAINKDNVQYRLNKLLDETATLQQDNVKCYTFGYDCGGTQGFINYPIITWENKNKVRKAFNLSRYINTLHTMYNWFEYEAT